MNFVNAELTKLSVNTFVTTKISYANMLAEICETLPGADAGVVTAALGCDTRIGAKYLMGAVGYGGPCFPRDNLALAALARDNAVPALLAEATDAVNRRQIPHLLEAVLAALPSGGTAGVLGLSYKPGTDVIEESQGLGLAKLLSRTGLPVVVYDPAAMDNARLHLGPGVTFAPSLADCASQADVLVIATPWPEFRSLCAENLKCGAWRPVIVDCWRILDPENFRGRAEYRMLGQGPSTSGKARAAGRAVTTQ
jgi:UDPglucose 6-dehydrogenase